MDTVARPRRNCTGFRTAHDELGQINTAGSPAGLIAGSPACVPDYGQKCSNPSGPVMQPPPPS
jgi:hypothetical protein